MIWALERRPPSIEYLLFADQPPRTKISPTEAVDVDQVGDPDGAGDDVDEPGGRAAQLRPGQGADQGGQEQRGDPEEVDEFAAGDVGPL